MGFEPKRTESSIREGREGDRTRLTGEIDRNGCCDCECGVGFLFLWIFCPLPYLSGEMEEKVELVAMATSEV